ncbi:hypothetical protein [Antribacter gilvus]|uniref:hypothetical protein n=1 Tax=Antribacter gilvus TaxID=2304675 RepID=UPI000F7AD83C|nr:hypothetical protein [Antribacter gilvus]
MDALRTARVVAAIQATVMAVFLAASGALRADNPFAVPDALLTLLLAVAACLPARWAAPSLIFSFALAVGVWTVSLSHYAVRGDLVDGLNHLPLVASAVVQSVVLARHLSRSRTGRPEEIRPHNVPATT